MTAFVSHSPHCWRHSYRTCGQQEGCTPPPAPSELLHAGESSRQYPGCPHRRHTATAPWTRQGREEGNTQEREKMRGISMRKKRQMLTSRYRCCVCGLMLTSGLRCSLWQRQRAELWPWCLGEVWECRPRPAQPRRPGAWSSPPPFWPYPRLFLWRTRGQTVASKKHGHTNTQANLIKYIWKKHCQFN